MLWSPYHAVVRARVRGAFAALSTKATRDLATEFRPDAIFRFSGDHAMGGELRGREQIGAWFARVRRLFPDLALVPLEIVVNGGPWNTTAAARFLVHATLPNGEPYENEGMQYLRIIWGAIAEDRLYEDTAHLERVLAQLSQAGVGEASASPLPETIQAAAG
jgi:ketosteroid isomerase-like protein